MPFTFSHPAAVIDLPKKYFSLSALVIGSMIPDIEYFIRLEPVRHHIHSWPGFLWLGIPIGTFIYLFFHIFLKYPLVSILPKDHQEKLIPVCKKFSLKTPKDFFKIILSIFIGILSHIIIDSFTHSNNFLTDYIPFLQKYIIKIPFLHITVSEFLQYFTTVTGIGYIILRYFLWFYNCKEKENLENELFTFKKKASAISSVIFISSFSAAIYGSVKSGILYDQSRLYGFFVYTSLASISFLIIGLVILCFKVHFDRRLYMKKRDEMRVKQFQDRAGHLFLKKHI
ncbi:MAG: DUF4184 family protein [Chitinispirillia bacterium]|jgi:hypothetical protein